MQAAFEQFVIPALRTGLLRWRTSGDSGSTEAGLFFVLDAERREHFRCLLTHERWSTLDGPWTLAELVGRAGELDGLIELWVLDLGPEVAGGEVLGLCHFSDRVNGAGTRCGSRRRLP